MRLPAVYLPHGGGPWPFVEMGLPKTEVSALIQYLEGVPRLLQKTPPKALLVVSAHWEEPVPTVMNGKAPPLYFDYYGFPPASYHLTWPAAGHPALAARVQSLLGAAGIPSASNESRGFDHGTFIPLKVAWPDADVPVVQLSLIRGLDPAAHLALGRALAPLRDEGVFLVGSGMSYHNLRAINDPRAGPVSDTFDAWLRTACTADPATRDRALLSWSSAPAARASHPREEHLLPLMVMAGAAGSDRGTIGWNGTMLGWRLSAVHFGV